MSCQTSKNEQPTEGRTCHLAREEGKKGAQNALPGRKHKERQSTFFFKNKNNKTKLKIIKKKKQIYIKKHKKKKIKKKKINFIRKEYLFRCCLV